MFGSRQRGHRLARPYALDTLGELADAFAADGIELMLAAVHAPVLALLERSGPMDRVCVEATVGAAVSEP